MKQFFRNNALSIVVLTLFILFWAGQLLTGWAVYNEERSENKESAVSFTAYLSSPHAIEATAENWESEFLQMCAFAVLTAFLVQRGSAESKDPGEKDPTRPVTAESPWPVRRGGWIRKVYEHSLSLALGLLFAVSLVFHAYGGTGLFNEERTRQGEPALSVLQFVGMPQFWFESLQNWQSEFLSIGAMVLLTIFLREKGSPESKCVESPHSAHE